MGYQDSITWAWHNPGPPSGPMGNECAAVVIAGTQRGNRTAHECVVECIQAWVKSQNVQVALEWLTKGAHCHHEEAQKELNKAGAKAVQYAVETFGPLLNLVDLKLEAFKAPAKSTGSKSEKTAKVAEPSKAEKVPSPEKTAKAPAPKKAPAVAKAPAKETAVAATPAKAAKPPVADKAPKADNKSAAEKPLKKAATGEKAPKAPAKKK